MTLPAPNAIRFEAEPPRIQLKRWCTFEPPPSAVPARWSAAADRLPARQAAVRERCRSAHRDQRASRLDGQHERARRSDALGSRTTSSPGCAADERRLQVSACSHVQCCGLYGRGRRQQNYSRRHTRGESCRHPSTRVGTQWRSLLIRAQNCGLAAGDGKSGALTRRSISAVIDGYL